MSAVIEHPNPKTRWPRLPSAASAFFDRAQLMSALTALHAKGESFEDRRKDSLALFRQALDRGCDVARQNLEARGSGLACAHQLAFIEDELIRAIHDYVTTYLHQEGAGALVVLAVGGYGRGTLAPGSDIDVVFLVPSGASAVAERVVEAILYLLWDLRQKVGHSTRCVEECLQQARDDITIRTSLLEARFVLGDRTLFETLWRRFDEEIIRDTPSEFVAAKLAERDARVERIGRSRYLVEPNVKEGKGGLRDLNTLFWIAKYVYRVREPSELVAAGLFSQREYRLFCRCEEFLWKVRCHLHFVAGRAEERLSFYQQRIIAERLGYSARAGLVSVERFMKHYFLIAKDVGDLTAIVCAALEERQAKPHAMLDRFFGEKRRRRVMVTHHDFTIENNRVTAASPDIFEANPVNLIRLFWLADKNGLAIHPDAKRLVIRALKRIDAKLRNDPEANRLFLDILTSRNTPEIVLRLMNEAGVLGRFIPEFGRIVALMQFNMYHHFTVDEHLLRAVGNLAAVEAHRLNEDHPLASTIIATLGNRTALYIALFLHDVAKGREEDHSLAGVVVARKICQRFGISAAEAETVAWLVENHLLMSDIAQRRDLGDRRTIENFAARVQTLERLKMLLVLTVCDIRAVGPGVWNGWKGELLRTLYWETEVVLAGGHSAIDRKRSIERAQQELRAALPTWSAFDFEAYAARHQPAYWLKVDLPHKLAHARLLAMTEIEMTGLVTDVATDAFRGVTELTVIAPDHPRLLSTVAGACAAASANIVDAQVFTTTDGLAVDTIVISRAFDLDEDELRRADRIGLTIERALKNEIQLADVLAGRRTTSKERDKAFSVPPEVTIDNSLSKRFTVVEISGLDRPGLLHDLTTIISKLALNIGSAHIATYGEKAVDAFYLTDLSGAKITSTSRKSLIKRRILEKFATGSES